MTGQRTHALRDAVVVILARTVGGGGLLLWVVCGTGLLDLHLGDGAALAWDGALSLLFFLQHSVMVRRPVKDRMARHVPARYLGAIYAIASGLVLGAVAVLWQRTAAALVPVPAALRWVGYAVAGLALAGFAWGIASLRGFDPFGVQPIRAHRLGRAVRPALLQIRGPYRWVRHPLYLFVLVAIWAGLTPTADRLLFGVLWTAWIVVGTILEERDLVAEMGAPYRAYQRRVPMLIPWRRPAPEELGGARPGR